MGVDALHLRHDAPLYRPLDAAAGDHRLERAGGVRGSDDLCGRAGGDRLCLS